MCYPEANGWFQNGKGVVFVKRLLVQASVLLLVAVAAGGCGPSLGENARRTGAEFVAAAAAGDRQTVRSMLSPRTDTTAEQVVESYQGLTGVDAFDAKKALPNESGVEYIVLVSGQDRAGVPHSSMLAVGREESRWVILKADSSLSY